MKIRLMQVVIVKKAVASTRSKAKKIARRVADRTGKSTETRQSYRFQQRPTDCFIDGTYRTVVLPTGVSLVIGTLKRGAQNRKSCKA